VFRQLLRTGLVLLLAGAAISVFAPRAGAQAAPGEGPGGPILLAVDDADPFGRYYAEILRAEGLNEFTVAGLGALDAQTLSGYSVVLLASSGVTDAQASALGGWVSAGGNLVAMRPDARLAGVLGLGADTGDLSEGYIGVDTGSPPGAGITGATMQFHGTADLWTLAGARPVATLYAGASSPTASPAVTLRDVGGAGGQAAAFTYDLARSVVYTRQGDPSRAGSETDGDDPIRSNELFSGGGRPNWVNFDKVAIPQADEQQRLLANLITQMSADRMPLPRFWYLPRGAKAAVVMTGDDHNNGGTAGQFSRFELASPPGCSVANWECIRATSYVYPGTSIPDAEGLEQKGFEIALHLTTGCADFTLSSARQNWQTQLGQFTAAFPTLDAPVTNRTHCIAWSDWASGAIAEREHGVRLDTNYYYWPAAFVQNRPGMFTGSGMPMRFAATNGGLIDVYQATTQLTDESGISYADHIAALLGGALGPQGYYGVFTTNMHTDQPQHAGADAIVADAVQRGVPVISARQMLDWLDGRNGSSFQGLSFAGGQLRFSIAGGARGLEAMVPASGGGGGLLGLTRDGAPVATTVRTVKGVDYAVFDAAPGAYVASYQHSAPPPDTTTTAPRDRTAPRVKLKLKRRSLRASKRGIVRLRVKCQRSERQCILDVRIRSKGKRLTKPRPKFVVGGGKTAKVKLKLTKAARARLVRRGSMKATVVIKARDVAGNRRTTRTRVRLLAPR
jgi:hypothetical protein